MGLPGCQGGVWSAGLQVYGDIIRNVIKMGLFLAHFDDISYNVFNTGMEEASPSPCTALGMPACLSGCMPWTVMVPSHTSSTVPFQAGTRTTARTARMLLSSA